jgi:hypothetical protein
MNDELGLAEMLRSHLGDDGRLWEGESVIKRYLDGRLRI